MSTIKPELSSTVSCSMKVSLGNYEMADVFLAVSGITLAHTPEDIQDMINASSIAFKKIGAAVYAKAEKLRETGVPA